MVATEIGVFRILTSTPAGVNIARGNLGNPSPLFLPIPGIIENNPGIVLDTQPIDCIMKA